MNVFTKIMKYVLLDDNGDKVLKMKFMCEIEAFLFSLYLYKLFTIIPTSIVFPQRISLWSSCCTAHRFLPPPPTFLMSLPMHFAMFILLWYSGYKELKERFPEISKGDTKLATGFTHIFRYPKILLYVLCCKEQNVISYETWLLCFQVLSWYCTSPFITAKYPKGDCNWTTMCLYLLPPPDPGKSCYMIFMLINTTIQVI